MHKTWHGRALLALALASGLAACERHTAPTAAYPSVEPRVETTPVESRDDAADDPAIWFNRQAPAASWVLGTDKRAGLYVYDLDGAVVDYRPAGRINNVDLRSVTVADQQRVLVGATERSRKALVFFFLEPSTGKLTPAGRHRLELADPYGFCLIQPAAQTAAPLYAFVTGKSGAFRQFQIKFADAEPVLTQVRSGQIGSVAEGCVGDDRTGMLYVAEETVGIWRYAADPATGNERTAFARLADVPLVADIEGLALIPAAAGKPSEGWLLASSQGDSSFAVFSLNSRYRGSFRLGENPTAGIDAVSETDGIAALASNALPGWPGGLFVAQDDRNTPQGAQNFKYAAWADILGVLNLQPLTD